jgi:zinc D-Ala-D-Ala carboxypeptidase
MDPRSARRRLAVLLTGIAMATMVIAGSMASAVTAAVPDLPSCSVADTLTKHRTLADWRRSILDSRYRLSSTYKPTTLVSTSSAGLNGGYRIRKGIVSDLKAMAAAARKANARFSVQSAYRSYATQKSTFAYWVKVHGYAVALKESARAGHSEHQLGTTVDLRSYGGKAPWDLKDWGTSRAGKWLAANSWKYGFVLSYPKGKTAVTCYTYEPWHFRYVGRTAAKRVHDSKLTLREYLWAVQTTGVSPTPPGATPTPTPELTPTPEPTPTPTPTPES